ncbi:anaerobic benzoate catabolism transcriptional regulator [Photorhabdus australis subsp. thailandensis]|uniref:Anaerobic benzoate catabolism transcriptional regulator n=1 Tax=Photorhabdus australis subsp. thailandensis TaxID=2805096 RepID=A0A1C0U7E0_9GAMM|nr:helix-turn-helix transcriptional regulator [Photorhabdus australis]OCQ53796.1 anaerobic benzoate catabolism transcriptional regulator [Photorhabdus australis subsp. thailandensis]
MRQDHLLVGKRIQKRRKELGMTAVKLAGQIGISQQQLSRYERGINRIDLSHLVQIASILDTPINWFFLDCYSPATKMNINKLTDQYIPIAEATLGKFGC